MHQSLLLNEHAIGFNRFHEFHFVKNKKENLLGIMKTEEIQERNKI